MPDEIFSIGNQERLADELFARDGVDRSDVDVAQIYDGLQRLGPDTLDSFGFCDIGGAGDFMMAGNIDWPNGRLPLNTAGGMLSEAYIHGLNLLMEGVKQICGISTSQVANARTCLVTAAGVTPTSAAILGA